LLPFGLLRVVSIINENFWVELDPEFATYMNKTWIKSSVNGLFDGRARVKNAIESQNKTIKDLVERKNL
jgi:hypothetical protein